jgi:hypothetical protein
MLVVHESSFVPSRQLARTTCGKEIEKKDIENEIL